ncbi:ABC transporter ATP-binding protein [Amycolatopsis pigmentata]|uniref:ABC transporter ATP-binding protein n=1 Tax=Amycolatopsis pigmentata TaxID=450801 RepID=A0ABW5FRW5_9PSEU
MPEIRVRNLTKSFGAHRVLDDVTFTVRDKECVTLLGPSGCGKTTTLMSIAGFQTPDDGTIVCGDHVFLNAEKRIDVPAERRNLGIVFQSYAVWPHLTVAGNVGFPLRIRRQPKRVIAERVAEVLALVELDAYADRYPYQLSGGQQQRVALARALAYSPDVLLLDEPFSNLDAKLRERAREWLKQLQHSLGLTTVFVTHDQDEAMALSDRIIVMSGGRILREGTPEEIYRAPADRRVAEFVGQCNFLTGTVQADGDGTRRLLVPEFTDGIAVCGKPDPGAGPEATIAVRPEDIVLTTDPGDGPEARVLDTSYLGDHYESQLALGALRLIVRTTARPAADALHVRIPAGVATFVH